MAEGKNLFAAYSKDKPHKVFRVMQMNNRKIKVYMVSVAAALAVGVLAGLLTQEGIGNFQFMTPAPLTPPAAVFPVVWTILYALMGISSAKILLAHDSPHRDKGLQLYLFQLIFNFFWCIFFFNMGCYGFSVAWIVGLWVLVLRMILSFYKVDKTAAQLQIPYLLWVSFATYLNYGVWLQNS